MSRQRFEELKSLGKRHARDDLDVFFDQLEPVSIEAMIGNWRGGVFATGNPVEILLKDFGVVKWHGKRFDSADRVQALIGRCCGFETHFPLGTAVLRRVEFRGRLSAAMIYDRRPIIDHFRRIDDNAMMGIMDRKGKIEVYFYLERET